MEYLLQSQDWLLSLIKNQFSNYFAQTVKAPNSFIEKSLLELALKMDDLLMIRDNQYVERELIELIILPIQSAIEGRNMELTFGRLSYLKMYNLKSILSIFRLAI